MPLPGPPETTCGRRNASRTHRSAGNGLPCDGLGEDAVEFGAPLALRRPRDERGQLFQVRLCLVRDALGADVAGPGVVADQNVAPIAVAVVEVAHVLGGERDRDLGIGEALFVDAIAGGCLRHELSDADGAG